MNRVGGNKGGSICPLPFFCCLFCRRCCCGSSSDEEEFLYEDEDMRRPLRKSKQYRKYYGQKRSKPRNVNNKQRRGLSQSYAGYYTGGGVSASPILHSGLKRLPFFGTLSDLTERSEEENIITSASLALDDNSQADYFNFNDASLIISDMVSAVDEEKKDIKNANKAGSNNIFERSNVKFGNWDARDRESRQVCDNLPALHSVRKVPVLSSPFVDTFKNDNQKSKK